jgi:hypothetical protein
LAELLPPIEPYDHGMLDVAGLVDISGQPGDPYGLEVSA